MNKLIPGLMLCAALTACVRHYDQRVQTVQPGYVAPPAQPGYVAPPPQADYAPPGTIGLNKTTGGALVGAGVGGLIGSKFGHGEGKGVATALGVIAGGLLGSQIGASLDRADQLALHNTTVNALETVPPGQALPWRNPDTGNYGSVVPQGVYQTASGQYCREFQQTIVVGGQQQHGYGRACRQPDGSWKVVE